MLFPWMNRAVENEDEEQASRELGALSMEQDGIFRMDSSRPRVPFRVLLGGTPASLTDSQRVLLA